MREQQNDRNGASVIDLFFKVVFWVTRALCVLVIMGCVVVLLNGMARFLSAYTQVLEKPQPEPEPGIVPNLPSFYQLQTELTLEAKRQADQQALAAQGQADQKPGRRDVANAKNLVVPHGLLSADILKLVHDCPLLSIDDGRTIEKAVEAMAAEREKFAIYHDEFLSGLGPFLDGWSHLREAQPKTSLSLDDALEWYKQRFNKAADDQDRMVSEAHEKRVAESEELKIKEGELRAKEDENLRLCELSLGGILGFVALPLLIQIERNTRAERSSPR